MKLSKTACAVALGCASHAHIAPTLASDDDIERLSVVSSRVAMPMEQLATSVTVIDDEQLIRRGFANLADALRIAPSVAVARNGGPGGPTTLRIRGEEGYRTQVRIDGVNISDPTGVQFAPQMAHVLSANLDRVEILRGTQGLLYGADAGGIVNITTRRYDQPLAGRVFAEYGRYDTRNISADLGGNHEDVSFYLSGQHFDTAGFNTSQSDTSGESDGYENTSFHTRLGYQFSPSWSLNLVARQSTGDGEYDTCFTASFAPSNDCTNEFEQTFVRSEVNYTGASTDQQLAYSKTWIDRGFFAETASVFATKGNTERVEYIADLALSNTATLVAGGDWQQDAITLGGNTSRTNLGGYVEYQDSLADDVYFTLGARIDDNQDFGQHVSYRLGVAKVWPAKTGEIKLRGSYGTGFRAPSLNEIAYNQSPSAFEPASSTELREEKTEGGEVALAWFEQRQFSYELVYFNQRITDGIFFDLAGFSGYLQDEGQARSQGVEFIASHQLNDFLEVTGNYTYNDAVDAADEPRIGRPRHLMNIGILYAQDRYTVSVNMRAVKDVQDIVGKLEDYEVLDVTAQYALNDGLTIHGRIENALDDRYVEVGGFNTPQAAVNVGMSYEF